MEANSPLLSWFWSTRPKKGYKDTTLLSQTDHHLLNVCYFHNVWLMDLSTPSVTNHTPCHPSTCLSINKKRSLFFILRHREGYNLKVTQFHFKTQATVVLYNKNCITHEYCIHFLHQHSQFLTLPLRRIFEKTHTMKIISPFVWWTWSSQDRHTYSLCSHVS